MYTQEILEYLHFPFGKEIVFPEKNSLSGKKIANASLGGFA
ncbi:hypothetical protein XSR1_50034 [Xenorhabdus szentirmaii DSM 16338]|uniref:Uncharacterized protein n=1 Tax=Xenorhabdus szentirmaii DSM 16338 TaxID=1427518 RepID=W1J441_9GAMM|nr:hypothetical protein XSR1_50034 [Xenorhabdus szentirmaii DSM 16338]